MGSYGAYNANGKRTASLISVGQDDDDRTKRPRHDAEEDDADDASAVEKQDEPKPKPTRGSRACTVCRRLKMKCVGAEHGPPCKRCIAGNHECIFEESNRGKRSTKKQELLARSLRKMERTLDTVLRSLGNPSIASGMVSRSPSPSGQTITTQALLRTPSPPPPPEQQPSRPATVRPASPKLHSLPDNSLNPLGLLAEASLANRRAQAPANAETRKVGVASEFYFRPGPMTILPLRRLYIERQVQPEMLSFTSTEEVVQLFDIYFDHMNLQCNLLDRAFHTPSLVCSRSPFLLTTICAIASKFYPARPELHPRLTDMSRKLAFDVPAQGYKSVEIVQAYLLLALWGCGPVERYEQDRTWLLLGMAIRMATDLNLHRKTAVVSAPTAEGRARDREVHNRERTWYLCFALDRSFSAQMGKPHSIKEDFIIRDSGHWCNAPNAIPSDAGLAAYVHLQRILSRSLDLLSSGTTTASGLQTDCDYYLVIKTLEAQVLGWHQDWTTRPVGGDAGELQFQYWRVISEFYTNYALLVINSFGLQNALERSHIDLGYFFVRCHTTASKCATIVRDGLGPLGYLKYSPDSHFVQCSYAVLTLLKLIRPEFQPFMEHEENTIALVKDVADVLESIAAGPMHTPALYATLLRALISTRTENGPRPAPDAQQPQAQHHQNQHEAAGQPTLVGNVAGGEDPHDLSSMLAPDQFESEMGPVQDISTFPPTMAPSLHSHANDLLSMDTILSSGFWDSVIVPGYSNTLDSLSGGFVYGAGGSGFITPRLGFSPAASGAQTPVHATSPTSAPVHEGLHNINAALAASTESRGGEDEAAAVAAAAAAAPEDGKPTPS
ncbi:hypothetical protein PUNSTDRAFT_89209 [Punctularia strigosozonata HHB-11173 SS5]|uniref:uncharacterized protein n=1 Tax=Punctularia strigosozonata (strain HHB-11173) TaxID=741275 RepID=UPI00044178CB|nr:uncharacterized protein PUNSTDRAFT_89209 [Punctularia strigosozonata HHB-11173 SS5]EIN07126.1 hypothetical protein PUNSTDRAFT_89209 [Punctularia strigosozonata HHB-11173 SS5]